MKTLYVGKYTNLAQWSTEGTDTLLLFCSNSLEAFNILKSHNDFKAIICEYNLSGNNGLYFYNRLKDEKKLSKIPFILLVEEHNTKIYNAAYECGIDDYFVINVTNKEQILKRVKQLSHNRKHSTFCTSAKKKVTYKFPLSKRIFDIVMASTALLLLSPLLLITIIAIRLESKGKVYYIAKRVGRKTFDFYKLRSMRSGSDKLLKQLVKDKNQYNTSKPEFKGIEEDCPKCRALPTGEYCSSIKYTASKKICDYWYTHQTKQQQQNNSSFVKIVDDPRITKIGKIIRNTSIDELPQLINVIKGDMSLVGNRPLPVYEAELLTQDQMSKRFLAPAGITGLWQVELRGKGGHMSEEERINLDNKYVDYFAGNNYSLWFDLKILLRTVPALFQKSTV